MQSSIVSKKVYFCRWWQMFPHMLDLVIKKSASAGPIMFWHEQCVFFEREGWEEKKKVGSRTFFAGCLMTWARI